MHDCLIVGAGVIGLSLAYELARHGLRVKVIDRGQPGREASWAGAGILPPAHRLGAQHPWDQLRALSHELHPVWANRLQAETGIDNGYRRCGGVYLARSLGEASSLHAASAVWRAEEGIQVDRLTAAELVALEPALAPLAASGEVRAAYHLPDEGQLRNPRHLQALVQACALRGVEIEAAVEALGFRIHSGRIEQMETNRGPRAAGAFAIAGGAWTRSLMEQLGLSSGILPVRGQMLLYHCGRPPFSRVINEGPRYLVPRDDGRVLAGSTEEEVGYDKRTTGEGRAELLQFAAAIVPALSADRIERAWAGLRPGSFDGFPYLGAVPGLANAFVAAGHFRSGLFTSTGTAVVLGELIRGERPQIDLAPFAVGRG
jgi:glycine oxidase